MHWMDVFATAAVVGGLVLAVALLVSAEPRRALLLWMTIALLGAVAVKSMSASVQAEPEWIAALAVFAAAAALMTGRSARVFSVAAGMTLVPAALAGASVLEVAWSSVPVAFAIVAGSAVAGGAVGYVLRPFRLRHATAFSDSALLVVLCSLAVMAGPTALLGWQRAAIAAEGDESSSSAEPLSLWCLLPVGLAFISGFAWRLWRARPSFNEKRKPT